MTQNTTQPENVALRASQWPQSALYEHPTPARSHSDMDIERQDQLHGLMMEYAHQVTKQTAEAWNVNSTIQHALIELQTAQDELQSMKSDIFGLLLLDRRLTVIRTLLEGVTT